MKLPIALLALSILATSVVLVPAADARAFCSQAVDGPSCPGKVCYARSSGGYTWWTCEDDIIICIRECGGPA